MTELETWLERTAAGRLGLPCLGLDVPLVECGFSSRDAVAFTGLIAEHLGIALAPTLLWAHPTIRRLAAHLNAAEPGRPAAVPARHPLDALLDAAERSPTR
ncbi:MAG: acyl carrier protein [Streptosporangiaceae bacterium]